MLKLSPSDITLAQTASDKYDAISSIARSLTNNQLVDDGYVEGMHNREKQNSTFLGNGIAIPHGTIETRPLVKQTGVAVHHYPNGVDWGDGNTVYVAIGIAAKSDEHLGILKQLTKVLSADGVEQALKAAKSEAEIAALLLGETQLEAELDASLVQLNFPASDMIQMSAVASGLLKNTGCAGSAFVADIVAKSPTHLGKGLWLVGSDKDVTRTGVSFVSTANDCSLQDTPVRALIAFAACNSSHNSILQNLSSIVFENKQETLINSSTEQVIALLNGETISDLSQENSENTAVFTIKNTHGLHARPGAMLVAEAKKFEATIRVSNLDGDGKEVNAKSLMKVIALGVKNGHQLQFSADGDDAAVALKSIGIAIASGLGEG
ncbi:bifunctional PTS system fructose-specific transporter subunit IIA/HPr protein [Vibrio orientalis CIP 102891 = ATCC 33934]|uniref:Multiphosphoryl transfer protein n=1 Tax=Vibrio orientalis CIP 102891 = ATCC 33934 TaxID=675816 RepID=C9QDU5_VIBOR|nr:fused PTS fructose transporter subunit IIA/HPr protein [Vibrio orientalis]EEX94085.1 fructose-specific phosphocarrier protein HPr/PTS system fructose-specific IIA component [Vibrio orientalis CIP 102891 = ATCC 33934]EGU52772.1 bifunctional PTS system fructose-specific transporter subunit IIA/HPr protein [Vibrio orientalis CIP 102891 = ATCC 33934]